MSAVMPEVGTASMAQRPAAVPAAAARPPLTPMASTAAEPSAIEKLEASRARLRTALLQIAHPPPRPSILDGVPGLGDLKTSVLRAMRSIPGAALIVESLESWWAQHPLHTAGIVAREASQEFMLPIARRNPLAVILGGIVIGGLFAMSKPWRWLLRPALFVGLVPQIASHALKRMPVESWMHMLSTYLGKRQPTRPKATRAPIPDPAPMR